MTSSLPRSPIGRPRMFEPEVALQAALQVFWRRGYASTSLDDLTAAMGLSRSSFYGTFGSKQAVLLEAVQAYVDRVFTSLEFCARSHHDPIKAARAMFNTITTCSDDDRGCLFVNSVAELAPDNRAFCALASRHTDRTIALMASMLRRAGFTAPVARARAAAVVSCAFGATIVGKAGLPKAGIAAMLAQAEKLLQPPDA